MRRAAEHELVIAEIEREKSMDVLKPNPSLLIALGSLIVHYEELLSPNGHEFDKQAIDTIMNIPEVQEWFTEMEKMALLPVKRSE